jgi:hypothetical protein
MAWTHASPTQYERKYTLLDLTTNEEKKYHSTQTKQFKFDPLRTDPIDVARKTI